MQSNITLINTSRKRKKKEIMKIILPRNEIRMFITHIDISRMNLT